MILIASPIYSEGAVALKDSLRANGVSVGYRHANRTNNGRAEFSHLINWGIAGSEGIGRLSINGTTPRILNPPQAINRASDKLEAFRAFNRAAVPTPNYATELSIAQGWIREGHKVYCRQQLRGHSGQGIVVARTQGQLVRAPLYTKGIEIHHEFRAHVFNGVVIDGVRKAFNSDVPPEERNRDIMNHAAGTIFVRSGAAYESFRMNQRAQQICIDAVGALGLDFGAVDIVTDQQGNYFVLEVNTAPGLVGTTLEVYTNAISNYLNNQPVTRWSNQTVEETQVMNIQQATVGLVVRFTPEANSTISTLVPNGEYTIERVGNEVIFVRNSRGRVVAYQPRHFTSTADMGTSRAPSAPSAPSAPRAPVAPPVIRLEGTPDHRTRTDVPPTSPERVVMLDDGTSVNVGGTALFNGTSSILRTGTVYTITTILSGQESGTSVLCAEENGVTARFLYGAFSQGTVNSSELIPEDLSNFLADSNGRRILEGDTIQVRIAAGGHNQAVGSRAVVRSLNVPNSTVTVSIGGRNVNIETRCIVKLLPTEVRALEVEEAALANQQTTTFQVGSNSYRVLTRDMDDLRNLLRRFTL